MSDWQIALAVIYGIGLVTTFIVELKSLEDAELVVARSLLWPLALFLLLVKGINRMLRGA